jgi:hypothetical protein
VAHLLHGRLQRPKKLKYRNNAHNTSRQHTWWAERCRTPDGRIRPGVVVELKCQVKNIQIFDGADNAVYDIFAATDEEFGLIFPNGTDVAFIDEVYQTQPSQTVVAVSDFPPDPGPHEHLCQPAAAHAGKECGPPYRSRRRAMCGAAQCTAEGIESHPLPAPSFSAARLNRSKSIEKSLMRSRSNHLPSNSV